MDSAAFLLLVLVSAGTLVRVKGTASLTALYGETIVLPCNGGAPVPNGLMFIKWKYEKDDGSPGDLLIKQTRSDQATVQATDDYARRVSINEKFSLLITQASLKDQRTFTCMVVSIDSLMEYPVSVVVYKKPSSVQIMDKNEVLQKDKLTTVGTCVVADANPAATVTWSKNGQPLEDNQKSVVISSSLKLDPGTGLSTTSSTLQYAATKQDAGAVFACVSTHKLINNQSALGPSSVHYPSENISLQILSQGPIIEGDNVTLKCRADGNPPPSSFFFYIKGTKTRVENSDNYTVTAISREAAGEYKCSLVDNEKMEASENIVVSYLDLSLSPSGKVVKSVGETLSVNMETSSSGDAKVLWMKDGKTVSRPEFSNLTFADAGDYSCEVSMSGLTRRQSFQLVVEGAPVITSLTAHHDADGKHQVLICEAEGVPKPSVQWSINGTHEKSSYTNGRAIHKITVTPKGNMTVTCNAINTLGRADRTINISSVFKEEMEGRESSEDQVQIRVIVGVVAGLMIAGIITAGLIYCLYMKKRRGSFKTKEMGTSEESKNLKDNNQAV
ncbi:CD166 antigen homolog [Archocentrus centrarchus]|uniref:CD166 antigen homolog n=1 Tax=Archocentrus centrarchus TaxID=63155 RepID=UPI0011E9CC7F|nr:CD166 antigen homolog [Archocentrus centrarchus]XP_030603026.1 CD166 antigen homolog [Archocentrus centrarchus]